MCFVCAQRYCHQLISNYWIQDVNDIYPNVNVHYWNVGLDTEVHKEYSWLLKRAFKALNFSNFQKKNKWWNKKKLLFFSQIFKKYSFSWFISKKLFKSQLLNDLDYKNWHKAQVETEASILFSFSCCHVVKLGH